LNQQDKTPEQTACFFMVAVLALYEREGSMKERHLNVLIETASPNLTRTTLGDIQKAAFRRINTENGITPDNVKDMVILNINMLGVMPPSLFHGSANSSLDGSVVGTA
jgi:hypothetical protein